MNASPMTQPRRSSAFIALAILPSIVSLILFYALVYHMHSALGKFPDAIGMRNFPSSLVKHAHFTLDYRCYLFILTFTLMPVALGFTLLFDKTRACAYYLKVYFVAYFSCQMLCLLAPGKFLKWWLD